MCCLLFLLRVPQDSPWGPQRPQESPREASGDPPHLKSVEDCRWLLNVVKAQVFCYRLGYSDQICKMDTILICIFARQGRQRAPTHRYVLSYHPRFSRLHHNPIPSKSSAIRRLSIREINHIQHCERAFSCFFRACTALEECNLQLAKQRVTQRRLYSESVVEHYSLKSSSAIIST